MRGEHGRGRAAVFAIASCDNEQKSGSGLAAVVWKESTVIDEKDHNRGSGATLRNEIRQNGRHLYKTYGANYFHRSNVHKIHTVQDLQCLRCSQHCV